MSDQILVFTINGFRTHAIRIPDERIYVAVLSNNTSGADPNQLAFRIAALAVGKPYQDPTPIELSPEELTRYKGVYKMNASNDLYVTPEENRLFVQQGQSQRVELLPVSSNKFFLKDNSLYSFRFIADSNDVVTSIEIQGRFGSPQVAKKADDSLS